MAPLLVVPDGICAALLAAGVEPTTRVLGKKCDSSEAQSMQRLNPEEDYEWKNIRIRRLNLFDMFDNALHLIKK
jgi:hypothetical protein